MASAIIIAYRKMGSTTTLNHLHSSSHKYIDMCHAFLFHCSLDFKPGSGSRSGFQVLTGLFILKNQNDIILVKKIIKINELQSNLVGSTRLPGQSSHSSFVFFCFFKFNMILILDRLDAGSTSRCSWIFKTMHCIASYRTPDNKPITGLAK
jgi:hypothetical protein